MRVLVTGATGKIGRLIVRSLLSKGISTFSVRALVRGPKAEEGLRQFLGPLASGLEVLQGDIIEPDTLEYAFRGVDAVIITTGPSAHVDVASLLGESAWGVISFGYSTSKPSYWFDNRAGPEHVDWQGQSNQIDAAKAAGARHVVLLSSMGGTKPDHFLNEKMADIALWKRKAEHHLVASGVPFTIVRAGGLFAGVEKQHPQQRAVASNSSPLGVSVDDSAVDGEWEHRAVPPEDLAALCVQCLKEPTARGRSFDIWSRGNVIADSSAKKDDVDLKALLARLNGKNCRYEDSPHDPVDALFRRKTKPKDGVLNVLTNPPNCYPQSLDSCESCECERGKFSSRRDVQDAWAPGVEYDSDVMLHGDQKPKALSDNPDKLKDGFRYDDHWEEPPSLGLKGLSHRPSMPSHLHA